MAKARDVKTGRYVSVTPPRPITAAVVNFPVGDFDRSPPKPPQGWQDRAWRLWEAVGVLHYPTVHKSEQIARLDWTVRVDGNDLEAEAAEKAIRAVTAPMDPDEAAYRLALNFEVAGDAWYLRRRDEWSVVASASPDFRKLAQGADIAIKSWFPDPVRPHLPDSPVRAALDNAEEVRVLQALSRSQSRNRVAQRGFILRPTEGDFPDGTDFSGMLHRMLTEPIADEHAASAVTPPDLEYPSELIEKWRHFTFESPYDDKLDQKLDNAIRRLALALNIPPEILTGMADLNHWSSWLAEESMYRAHLARNAALVGDTFAKAMMQATSREGIEVEPDPTELLARRSSVTDAFKARELQVVNDDYVRRVIGADLEDAPVREERAVEIALRLVSGAPSLIGILGFPEIVNQIRQVIGGAQLPEAASGNGNGQVPRLGTPERTGPPPRAAAPESNGSVTAAVSDSDEELDRLARQLTDLDIRLLASLEGATEMTITTARDRVSSDEVGAQEHVAEEVDRLGNAWNRQVTQARGVLTNLGVDASGPEWDEAQAASVALLRDGITEHIIETLGRTDSEMPKTPVLLLRQVLATAGGSSTAVVAAIVRNPAPTFKDPQGFAIGVLTLKEFKGQDIEIVQWRFRYGTAARDVPFLEHRAVDGQFMTADGYTKAGFEHADGTFEGYHPGDHKGCLCYADPVFRVTTQREPEEE